MNGIKSFFFILALSFSFQTVSAQEVLTPVFQKDSNETIRISAREALGQSDSMDQLEIRTEMSRLGLSESLLDSAAIEVRGQQVQVVGLDSTLNETQLAYIGVRIGFPFVMGTNLMLLNLDPETYRNQFHIEFEAATSVLISTLNMAFGYHVNQGSFFIGARLHYIYVLDIFGGRGVNTPGFGPELGWLFDLDRNKNWIASVRLGGVGFVNGSDEVMFLPEVRLGLAVKLFGVQ